MRIASTCFLVLFFFFQSVILNQHSAIVNAQVYQWAKSMGGTLNDLGSSIAVDASGNVYITGYFNDTVDFDPGPGTTNLISAGGADIFIQKLNDSGNFIWAKDMGGTSFDRGYITVIAPSGNVYTTGFFKDTVDFEPGIGTANLVSAGVEDIFIQKLDASGNFIWAKSMGGTSTDIGYAIAVDIAENVYTIGSFQGTIDFDPGPGTTNLVSAGAQDIFIQKLDASGNYMWAKNMGGVVNDVGLYLAIDSSSNVYATGYFSETADFDPGVDTANLVSTGSADIFIQKLDAFGNYLWAKRMGGTSLDNGHSLVVSSSGSVFTTGIFRDTVDFDPGSGTTNLISAGGTDIFIQKLDASGNLVWVKSIGGTSADASYSIAIDTAENVYITGYFNDTIDFDPGPGTTNLVSAGGFDIFIQKLDASGNFIWAKRTGGTSNDVGSSIAVDSSGNVHVTGYFYGTVDFDPGAGIANLSSVGSFEIFVAKYFDCSINPITISATAYDETCDGLCDGSIYLNVAGGTVPYSYSWSNSDTTEDIANLCNSAYYVTITDSNGCSAVDSATINAGPTTPVANAGIGGNECDLNFLLNATPSLGSGTWTKWCCTFQSASFSPNPSDPNATVTVNSYGTWLFKWTEVNGTCSVFDTVTVNFYEQPVANAGTGGNECDFDFSLIATASVGTGTWTVQSGPGTGAYIPSANNAATAVTVTALGTYIFRWTEANGTCSDFDEVTVSFSSLSLLTSSSPTNCGGTDGTATVIVSGGTGPYAYLWNNGQTDSIAIGLVAGTYTVTVTDFLGCSAIAGTIVTAPAILSISTSSFNSSCGVNSGTASIIASGGTQPYTYQWSSGATTVTADSLSSGIYIVTVTDANGCTGFGAATVSDSAGPAISEIIAKASCNGAADGAIDISVSGGATPYTYFWSNGFTSQDLNGLLTGPYEIEVADAVGCLAIKTIVVAEDTSLSLITSVISSTCGTSTGSATVTTIGGAAPLTYLWDDPGSQTSVTATGLAGGIYTVSVTDMNNCIVAITAAINDLGSPVISVDSILNAGCGGAGSVYISTSGGTTPYTYNWSSGDTTEDLLNVPGGSYVLVVTGGDSCQATANIILPQSSAALNPICLVTVDTILGTNQVVWEKQQTTGIAFYNIYKESTQAGVYYNIGSRPYDSLSFFTDSFSNPLIRSWRYKIAAVDSCGNESALSDEHKTIHLVLSEFGSSIYLIWDDYQGFSFGTYYIHRYTLSTGWQLIDSLPSNLHTYTDTAQLPGDKSYYIEAKHPDGCIATKNKNYNSSISNTKVTAISGSTLSTTTSSTNATSGFCDGTATATPGGGVPPYTYAWNTIPVQTIATADGLCGNIIYNVLVTDANGDTASSSVMVDETSGTLVVTMTANDATQGSCDGTATVTITSGTAPYTYLWSTSPFQTNATATGLCPGSYNVVITDALEDTTISVTIGVAIGIEVYDNEMGIQIYPNPSKGVFTIEMENGRWKTMPNGRQVENVSLIVYDALGREILKSQIVNRKSEIDLSEHPAGVYQLQIALDRSIFKRKLVIQ